MCSANFVRYQPISGRSQSRTMKFKAFFCVFLCFCVVSLTVEVNLAYSPPFVTCEKEETCTEIRQCPLYDELLDKSSKPPPHGVKKIVRVYLCALHEHIPYVCCLKPTSPPIAARIGSPTPPALDDELPKAINRHRNFNLLPNRICGPISINARTPGTKTAIKEYPWMALLVYYSNEGPTVNCGGTVITERYVVTAARCVNSKLGGVRLGEHNLETVEDCDLKGGNCAPPTQDFIIENILVHPEYNSITRENDIALLRLASLANFTYSNVRPICLPMEKMELSGKFILVAGWGLRENDYSSLELKKITLRVLPISACQRKHKRANITSKQICAGGNQGMESCVADIGGPMMYVDLIDGLPRFVQYGIFSHDPRFCRLPGVFTKVSRYLDWILDNLKP